MKSRMVRPAATPVRRIALISLVFPASYMVASWAISLRLRLMGRP